MRNRPSNAQERKPGGHGATTKGQRGAGHAVASADQHAGEMMKGCTSLSQFRFNNQSTLVLLGSDILIGLTQPITISFFNVQPSGVYADLLPIIKAYFVDPPPTGPPPASNWTYFITASLPP